MSVLHESENVINSKLLVVIMILYLSTQINARLKRLLNTKYYKGESGLCMIIGLICGFIGQTQMDKTDVTNVIVSLPLLYRLLFVPTTFFDLCYNVNHFKPGFITNSVIAILTGLTSGVAISFFFYFMPSSFNLNLDYIMCLKLGIGMQTVDTDNTITDTSKTMALIVNLFLLMILQYLSNPGEHNNYGSPVQITVMVLLQTIIPLVIAFAGTLIALVPLRMQLSHYIQSKAVKEEDEDESEI